MAPSRSTDPPAPPAPEPGRLDSWKEIAVYLNRSITTVQRWEQQEGLPVHRLLHSKSGSVYSLTHELDAWRSQRDSLPEEGPAIFSSVPAMRLRRWHVAVLSSVVLSMVALGGLAAALGWPSSPPRITSVRTVVADLERFGGRLRSTEYRESPYANWSWTSDGERVYLALPRLPDQGDPSSYALYQVPIAGGEPTELSLPFEYEVRLLDFVPEESALLVRGTSEAAPLGTGVAGMPLWLVSTIDGTARRIPNVVGNWADVAPDGQTLALIRPREKDLPRRSWRGLMYCATPISVRSQPTSFVRAGRRTVRGCASFAEGSDAPSRRCRFGSAASTTARLEVSGPGHAATGRRTVGTSSMTARIPAASVRNSATRSVRLA